MPHGQETGLSDPDDLVVDERFELDAVSGPCGPDDRELNAAGDQSFDDLAAGCDLDLDADVRIVGTEAAERVRQQVDAGCGRGTKVDRPRL